MEQEPETLEALQVRHRKEQRDLIARITQKKKSATKKTRKGVNDECERLEQELKERQAQELAALHGDDTQEAEEPAPIEDEAPQNTEPPTNGLSSAVSNLTISPKPPNDSTEPQPNAPKKKPNRAKARLARRAAEQEALATQAAAEALSIPDLRAQEQAQMRSHFPKYSLEEKEIRADGHCLYAAVADQMETQGLGLKPWITPTVIQNDGKGEKLPSYKVVRHAAADFIQTNPDDFVGFMEEPLEEYLRKIRETGEWGGHMELVALAKTYGLRINVLHGDGTVDRIDSGEEEKDGEDREIWLGYYRHGFGLGEHYNSLRRKN